MKLFSAVTDGMFQHMAEDGVTIWEATGRPVRAALERGDYQGLAPDVLLYVRDMLTTPTASDQPGDTALERQRIIQRSLAPQSDATTIEERSQRAIGAVLIPAAQYDTLLAEHGL